MIRIKHVEKLYPIDRKMVKVLDNINLDITKGELVSIMGPSGSGKTSLLNIMGLIDTMHNGSVMINGHQTEKLKPSKLDQVRAQNIAYVFQEYNLIETLSAFDNIALACSLRGYKLERTEIDHLLSVLDINECRKKYPNQLSGGQKQRIAIARALINQPKILLCDEPTGALDQKNSMQLMKYLTKINQELGITIIIVTHDPKVAQIAKRIVFIKDGQIHNQLNRHSQISDEDYLQMINQANNLVNNDE